ncbi:helix-hairpin-helix domain-containing protein [Fastidiosibacter lacustris]|uniref:helix-hairpin-helix domain-containing protein n=1 Tax=Fastidiosibacter lacustris TaxID=2056695 RepID=UPI000E35657A|nr:Tex-like N-terminal domain-containing protein [Fastidiosibacter lacustris]
MNLQLLTQKGALSLSAVNNIIKLLDEGATIPFIARYRKEATDGITDAQLRDFYAQYQYLQKLDVRREEIINILQERELYNNELQTVLHNAQTLTDLEDIYQPFKQKRNTRAQLAIDKGLQALADRLMKAYDSIDDFYEQAARFVKEKVTTVEEAIQGAMDIAAEYYADNPKERAFVRDQVSQFGQMQIKITRSCDKNGNFFQFDQYQSNINKIPAHRLLAIFRGVTEKELSLKIEIDHERYKENMERHKLPKNAAGVSSILLDAYYDGYKRLLYPAIEREIINDLKEKAESSAMNVFAGNLAQLLMTPAVQSQAILGVDPGFKTGAKLAVINQEGMYLDHAVIYPVAPFNKVQEANAVVTKLVNKYKIDTVAIGNGTASRELQDFFAQYNKALKVGLRYTVVSEAGASVYSASKLAEEEYPDLDVTIRGAISIAQRLQNPMATLVKIDPKSLGIGQYQHDVDQKKLAQKLHDITEAVVNNVGVNLNTASYVLLSYVSGINTRLAKEIVSYRNKYGAFTSVEELKKIKGLGDKTFEQCSGFMRIPNAKNILDNTGVHPENYSVATAVLKEISNGKFEQINIVSFAKRYNIGEETLKDIIKELKKPGFDPRNELPAVSFSANVLTIENLQVGTSVSGVVRNITDFGVFVDIGLKNDGMIHISELSQKRVNHPTEIVSLNEQLSGVKVIFVDVERQRVGLSLK